MPTSNLSPTLQYVQERLSTIASQHQNLQSQSNHSDFLVEYFFSQLRDKKKPTTPVESFEDDGSEEIRD